MASQLQFASLFAFAALMLLAAIEDLRRLVIPNALTLSLCMLWPLYALTASTLWSAAGALGCAVAVFLVGALLFSRGYIGGGVHHSLLEPPLADHVPAAAGDGRVRGIERAAGRLDRGQLRQGVRVPEHDGRRPIR